MTEAQPQETFEQQVARWKASVEQLRLRVKAVYASARQEGTPPAFRVALEQARSIQDSLEEFVALAITVKGAMERIALAAHTEYDEAWAAESGRDNSTAVRRGPEMEGPRERYARVDLKVFSQLRAWRQAEQQASLAREAYDEVWVRYRAVNATRDDLHALLRAYAFEISLDRT